MVDQAPAGPARDIWKARFAGFKIVGAKFACENLTLTSKASVLLTEDAAREAYWKLVWFYHGAMDNLNQDLLWYTFATAIGEQGRRFLAECDSWDMARPSEVTHVVRRGSFTPSWFEKELRAMKRAMKRF